MHQFEIIEHALCDRGIKYPLISGKSSKVKVRVVVYKYIKEKRSTLKLKSIWKLRKKIKKKLRKSIREIRKIIFPITSVQTV